MKGFEDPKIVYEHEDKMVCDYCKKKLNKKDKYHMQFGTCDQECYMHNVGMSWSDFV